MNELQQAIATSRQQTETVKVESDATTITDVVDQITKFVAGETDWSEELDGTFRVWGWTDLTPEDEEDWALSVRLLGAELRDELIGQIESADLVNAEIVTDAVLAVAQAEGRDAAFAELARAIEADEREAKAMGVDRE